MRVWAITWLVGLLGASPVAHAQTSPTAWTPKTPTTIDEDPIPSPRANGMGGALGTTADNLDAAFHNPAGIGGLDSVNKNSPWVRKLYFPELNVEANKNPPTFENVSAPSSKTSGSTSTATPVATSSEAGEREYARGNAIIGAVVGRTMVVPFYDAQIAAVPETGTNLLSTHYRTMTGVGYGFSAQDPKGRLSLGYFGYSAQRQETLTQLDSAQIDDVKLRQAGISTTTDKYTGNGNNIGGIWRLDYAAAPTFGLNVKNLGDTRFKSEDGGEDVVVKQDAGLAFSLSPRVGRGQFNTVVEVDELGDGGPYTKKYHLGTELLLGGLGSYARFGIRAGYNEAGPSGGLNLNLGLIGFEASVYYVDLAPTTSTDRVVEQRGSASFYVNVAEF